MVSVTLDDASAGGDTELNDTGSAGYEVLTARVLIGSTGDIANNGDENGDSASTPTVTIIRRDRKRGSVIAFAIAGIVLMIGGILLANPLIVLAGFPLGYLAARRWDDASSSEYMMDANELERVTGCVVPYRDYEDYAASTVDSAVLYDTRFKRSPAGEVRDAIARGDHVIMQNGKPRWVTRAEYDANITVASDGYDDGIGIGKLKEPEPHDTASVHAGDDEFHVIHPLPLHFNGSSAAIQVLNDGHDNSILILKI